MQAVKPYITVTHRNLSVEKTRESRPDWNPEHRVQTTITVVAYVPSREDGDVLAARIEGALGPR